MNSIVTVTVNPTVDRNTSVEHVGPNRKLRCEQPSAEPGGGGINVSRAIRILGGESTAIYAAGGYAGHQAAELLDREGLNHRKVEISGETRQNLIVVDRTSNEQYRFGMPGPRVSGSELNELLQVLRDIGQIDYLVASGSLASEVPVDFYAQLARAGTEQGARVIVDAGGEPLMAALEEGLFLIKPNIRELDDIAGRELQSEGERVHEVRSLMKRGKIEAAVVSLGRGGSLLVTADAEQRFRSPSVPIRSRIGAGDSMVGGMVLKLAGGAALEEAVLYGTAAGASAVMTPGTELCRRDTTESLFRELKTEDTG